MSICRDQCFIDKDQNQDWSRIIKPDGVLSQELSLRWMWVSMMWLDPNSLMKNCKNWFTYYFHASSEVNDGHISQAFNFVYMLIIFRYCSCCGAKGQWWWWVWVKCFCRGGAEIKSKWNICKTTWQHSVPHAHTNYNTRGSHEAHAEIHTGPRLNAVTQQSCDTHFSGLQHHQH